MSDEDDLELYRDTLSVAEVAHKLRVSKMTVYRLLHNGEIASFRVGRSFRIPRRAVATYLRASWTSEDDQ